MSDKLLKVMLLTMIALSSIADSIVVGKIVLRFIDSMVR